MKMNILWKLSWKKGLLCWKEKKSEQLPLGQSQKGPQQQKTAVKALKKQHLFPDSFSDILNYLCIAFAVTVKAAL